MARQTFTKTIHDVSRMGGNLSTNGSPRYRVTFTDGSMIATAIDASVNYGISNSDYREGPVHVTVEHGNIIGIVDAAGEYPMGAVA